MGIMPLLTELDIFMEMYGYKNFAPDGAGRIFLFKFER
jgi:hypothetical protein